MRDERERKMVDNKLQYGGSYSTMVKCLHKPNGGVGGKQCLDAAFPQNVFKNCPCMLLLSINLSRDALVQIEGLYRTAEGENLKCPRISIFC